MAVVEVHPAPTDGRWIEGFVVLPTRFIDRSTSAVVGPTDMSHTLTLEGPRWRT